MLHAIVYTSNAGSTARYAQLLGQVTGLPIFSAQEAHKNLANGDILYLGWVMAGTVKGYQQAAKRYRPCSPSREPFIWNGCVGHIS